MGLGRGLHGSSIRSSGGVESFAACFLRISSTIYLDGMLLDPTMCFQGAGKPAAVLLGTHCMKCGSCAKPWCLTQGSEEVLGGKP